MPDPTETRPDLSQKSIKELLDLFVRGVRDYTKFRELHGKLSATPRRTTARANLHQKASDSAFLAARAAFNLRIRYQDTDPASAYAWMSIADEWNAHSFEKES